MPSAFSYSHLAPKNHHWEFIFRRDPQQIANDVPSVTILASQWQQIKDLSPCGKMLLAMLEDAVEIMAGRRSAVHRNKGATPAPYKSRRKNGLQDETAGWFSSDAMYFGSFLFVCEHLKLEPGPIRKAVLGDYWRLSRAVCACASCRRVAA